MKRRGPLVTRRPRDKRRRAREAWIAADMARRACGPQVLVRREVSEIRYRVQQIRARLAGADPHSGR